MKTTQVLLNRLLFCFCIILPPDFFYSFGLRAKPALDTLGGRPSAREYLIKMASSEDFA